jgi:hypothetical protein
MKTVQVSEAVNSTLDWLVAKCAVLKYIRENPSG